MRPTNHGVLGNILAKNQDAVTKLLTLGGGIIPPTPPHVRVSIEQVFIPLTAATRALNYTTEMSEIFTLNTVVSSYSAQAMFYNMSKTV